MDGPMLAALLALLASQFFLYYRLGKLEEKVKNVEANTCKGRSHGKSLV